MWEGRGAAAHDSVPAHSVRSSDTCLGCRYQLLRLFPRTVSSIKDSRTEHRNHYSSSSIAPGPLGAPAYAHLSARGVPCPPGRSLAEHLLHIVSVPGQLAVLLKDHDVQAQPPGTQEMATAAAAGAGGSGRGPVSTRAAAPGAPPDGVRYASHATTDGEQAAAEVAGPPALAKRTQRAQRAQHSSAPTTAAPGPAVAARSHTRSVLRELAVLFWRTWLDMRRNPSLLLLHILLALRESFVNRKKKKGKREKWPCVCEPFVALLEHPQLTHHTHFALLPAHPCTSHATL